MKSTYNPDNGNMTSKNKVEEGLVCNCLDGWSHQVVSQAEVVSHQPLPLYSTRSKDGSVEFHTFLGKALMKRDLFC